MPDPTPFPTLEQVSGQITGTLTGNDGVTPVPGSALTSLLLSVYVIKSDGAIQYLRNRQNVLNANNVTISEAGVLIWTYQPSDTTLVEAIPYERHLFLFEWAWAQGQGKYQGVLVVENLVPVS